MSIQRLMLAVLVGDFLFSTAVAVETYSLNPPVLLPDGQEFKTWERPLTFSKTYYVAQSHPQASDQNPGTEQLPFKTINHAAQVLQPGERVVVAAGVYRERVCPARGGANADQMISYEAAPGATVILSGAMPLGPQWTPSPDSAKPGANKLWSIPVPKDIIAEENPFAQLNLTDEHIDKCMPWATGTKGKAPNILRRGLVFLDDQRLRQVATKEELTVAKDIVYWVEKDGLMIYLATPDGKDPNRTKIEVTTHESIFAPEAFGLGYIRVRGFTIERVGNRFPMPQYGALSVRRGHHWLIEDNTVRQCNSLGIDIGCQFDVSGPPLAEGGQHIVRRNTITDCGIGGIEGGTIEHTLIEENRIARCGWQRAEFIWETGGIKVHVTTSTLVRRNVVWDSIAAPGIWMDYNNRNSRCTQNVVIQTEVVNGALFMEASQAPNFVDHNIVWGSTSSGIYQHDCDELVIAHNMVGQCKDAGIRMQICQGRMVNNRLTTAKRNKILGNILVDNRQPLAISDPDNICDANLFGVSREPFDLAEWRKKHGWDQNSTTAVVHALLDPRTRELTWSVEGRVPEIPASAGMTFDFQCRPYSKPTISPGPFESLSATPVKISLK